MKAPGLDKSERRHRTPALAGAKVTFGKTRGTGTEGEYHVIYAYEEERVGKLPVRWHSTSTPPHSR